MTVTDVHEPILTEQHEQYQKRLELSNHCTVAWDILNVADSESLGEHKGQYQIVADKGCLDFFMPQVTKVTGVRKAAPRDILTNLWQLLNNSEGAAIYVNNTMHLASTVSCMLQRPQTSATKRKSNGDTNFGKRELRNKMWYSGPHSEPVRHTTTKSGRTSRSCGGGHGVESHCFAVNIGVRPFTWSEANKGDDESVCHKISNTGNLVSVSRENGWTE